MTAPCRTSPHPNDPETARAALETEAAKLSPPERASLLRDIDAALARIGTGEASERRGPDSR